MEVLVEATVSEVNSAFPLSCPFLCWFSCSGSISSVSK